MFSPVIMIPLLTMMVVALFAPSTLYLFSQRAAYRNWTSKLIYLPALMAIGVGLAVNNTRAVIEGLLGRRSEFVRTPKLGLAAEGAGLPLSGKSYQSPPNRLYLVEIFMGLWALAAFVGYLLEIGSLAGSLLLVQAVGFIYVGVISVTHRRHAARPSC